MQLVPDSWGADLLEVNHCHGKGRGHPCTGPQGGEARHVDEHGVTHVGDFVELYHGTSQRRANSIAKQGLRADAVKKQTMPGDSASSRQYAWLAKRQANAQSYAEMHRNPVVVTFRIPRTVYEQMNPYGRNSGPDSAWFKQGLPAEYVHVAGKR